MHLVSKIPKQNDTGGIIFYEEKAIEYTISRGNADNDGRLRREK